MSSYTTPTATHAVVNGVPALPTSESLASSVELAATRLDPYVIRTPTEHLAWLDTPDREVWVKIECWQRTGAFKFRGATNAMLDLPARTNVVASSAGNHGLAVATAARRMEHNADIFVPIGASTLKIRRIEDAGARVHIIGRDVHETTIHALEYAETHASTFISPYANEAVAAGNGTVVREATEEAGTFDAILVPLGGGGLIAGAGAWARQHNPKTRIIGVHPQEFGRDFKTQRLSDSLFGPTVPTIADGLAAQLHERTPLRDVLDDVVERVVEIPESGFTTAIYALLYKSGLLVEGAGAAGIAALLNDEKREITGKVLVVLTGGNISSAELARSMTSDIPNAALRRDLGLRRVLPALDAERIRVDSYADNELIDHEPLLETPAFSVPEFWRRRLVDLDTKQQNQDRRHREFRRLTNYRQLEQDPLIGETHEAISQLSRSMIDLTVSQSDAQSWLLEERVRYIVQLQSFLRSALDRASPAYDQSKRAWFYDTASQGGAGVNYARYGVHELRTAENALKNMLGFDQDELGLLLTSSGMAAYQLLEGYVLRAVLKPGDTIARCPYVYFEADEQLVDLEFFDHVYSKTYEASDIVATVEEADARLLFVDPIANVPGLPTVDLRALAAAIGARDWSQRWIVIDGSLLSGGMNPFKVFNAPNHPKVLYYESASKYIQFGLDLQMAGLCVFPTELEPKLRKIRRNAGLTMYPPNVELIPVATRGEYVGWMKNLTANASRFALLVAAAVEPFAKVRFPDEWTRYGWQHGGALVTIEFYDHGMNNRDGLEYVIETCLRRAKALDISLIKGVSFGFSTSRLSASSAMADNSDPFLRFSIGSDESEVRALAACVIEAIGTYVEKFSGSSGVVEKAFDS